MFTRFFNSIRESIGRSGTPTNRNTPTNTTSNKPTDYAPEHASEYSTDLRRRSSITEELMANNDTHNMFSTSQSLPVNNRLARNNSIAVSSIVSEPVPIESEKYQQRRRRSSTVFGISNVTADDYVQKDLISSSWS